MKTKTILINFLKSVSILKKKKNKENFHPLISELLLISVVSIILLLYYIFFKLIFYIKDLQSNLDKYSTYDQQDPFYFLSDLLDNCVSATLRSLFQFSVS